MADKKSLESQVKSLEKAFGTIVKAFKELNANVKSLEDNVEKNWKEELQEIMRKRKELEDVISANSDAIKKIDNEIAKLQVDSLKADVEKEDKELENKKKKCKYFNTGHCKYKMECKFSHQSEVCIIYLEGGKCAQKSCENRHAKICKWSQEKKWL